jgi:Multiubiquitin
MEKYKLNEKEFQSKNSQITGKEILESGNFLPVTDFELLVKINEKGFEPVQLSEKIDLTNPGIEGFYAKSKMEYSISVDGKLFTVHSAFMTPIEILRLVGLDAKKFFLKQLKGDDEIGYKHDSDYKITIQSNLIFVSSELIVSIEEYCHDEIEIPKGCKYEIRVDGEKYIVDVDSMNGKGILTLAGKVPYERFQLNQKFKGGRVKKVAYDEIIDFTCPGVERFMTLPLDQTEG